MFRDTVPDNIFKKLICKKQQQNTMYINKKQY